MLNPFEILSPRMARCSLCAVLLLTGWPMESFGQSVRIIKRAALPPLTQPPAKAVVTTNNQTMSVKVPSNVLLAVRRSNIFTNVAASRTEGGTNTYDLRPGDIYVTTPKTTNALPISTTGQSLPGTVHGNANGKEVEGHINVAVQSEELVFNPAKKVLEGVLVICFVSPNFDAFKENSFDVWLQSSAGLSVGVTNFTLTAKENDGCRFVPVQCPLNRTNAHVIVNSRLLGTRQFNIELEQPRWTERHRNVLVLFAQTIGGILLGALGGLVRAFQPPRARNIWTPVGTGAFCGLVLMLLGQVGVQKIFHIDGAITTSVLLGLCAVFGYLGVRLLERFAPEDPK